MFTSGYVNTETILHFFYEITNERGTKTVFTYAHAKWFYGQSERAYYFNYFITFNLTRSTPLFLRGDLKFKYVLLFIFHTEFIIGLARSSLRGGTLGTPFLLRILCLSCSYATALKDYFLLGYLLKYDFNSVTKFIIIFILSILFLFCPNLTVRPRNLS